MLYNRPPPSVWITFGMILALMVAAGPYGSGQSLDGLPFSRLVERQTLNTSSSLNRFHNLSLSQINDRNGAIVLVCN
jgi:hypothetical protein